MERILTGIIAIVFILIIILASYYWNKKCFLSVFYNDRYDNNSCNNACYNYIDCDNTNYDNICNNNTFYVMPISRGCVRAYLFIIIPLFILCGFLAIISIIFLDDILIFFFFYFFALLGIYAYICALLEKYVLTADFLIRYIPLLPPKKIKISEITTVKYTENKANNYLAGKKFLVGYHDTKKLFSIDESFDGCDLLLYLFFQNGKLETVYRPVVEHFSVAGKRSDIISAVLGFPIFLAIWIYTICMTDVEWLLIIMSAPCMLFYFSYVLDNLLLKVTVNSHTMSVRNSFGITKTYDISQITKVQEKKKHIVLYAGSEKIIKLPKDYENFDLFIKWLSQNRMQREGAIDNA